MGRVRTCEKFTKVKGGVLRCSQFKEEPGHPACDRRLRGGGRSPGLMRRISCANGAPIKMGGKPKRRRKSRR